MSATRTEDQQLAAPAHRVICAAVKLKDGRVLCGIRHFDSLMRGQIMIGCDHDFNVARELIAGAEQGFADSCGIFLSRQSAWNLAVSARQFDPEGKSYRGIHGTLFSEDVW